MSTNQEIWGSESDWLIYNTAFTGTTKMNALLTGNFGTGYYIGSVHYTSGCLQTGYYNDVLPTYRPISGGGALINEPIDNSISYCGLGNESTYSRLAYLEYKVSMFDSGFNNVDDRAVTNFAFCASQGSNYGFNAYNDSTTTAGAIQASRCRIAPMGYNGDYTSISKENYNRLVTPYVSIPVRNFILTPVVLAATTINTSAPNSTTGMDIRSFAWWDYMDTTQQRNYTTHPYILQIGVQPFCSRALDTINPVTGVPQTARSAIGHANDLSGIMVLSPLTVCDGEPSDVANPQEVLTDIYSYYLTRGHKASTGNGAAFPIFGYSAIGLNDQNYIVAPQTNSDTDASARRLVFWTHPNAQLVKVTNSNPNNYSQSGWYYLEYYNGLFEWVIQQIACFGLFFTFDKNTAQTGALNDPLMYLGVLDANGIGHGDYSTGEDNENQPQWEWDTTNNSSYKPSDNPDVDPNSYGGKMRTRDLSVLSTATQRYALSPTATVGMLNELWDIMGYADPDEALSDYSVGEFLASNPIDCIVSLQYIPVVGINDGTNTHVRFGTHDTAISCQGAKTSIRVDCGSYTIYPRFGNNWIDRQTKITLYLPFCGTVNLDPEMYMGKSVNVEYLIDLTTGACSAAVSMIGAGGERIITDIANGNCAMDLPVTGIQQQTLNSQLFNASEQTKQLKVNNAFKGFNSIMSGVSSLQGGNPVNGINGLLGVGQDIYNIFQSEKIADYNLQHTMIPTKMIGTTGGITGAMCELYPTIIFERPYVGNSDDWSNFANYAHSIGYACCISGNLSDFTGYTEITNVDLSGFNATATEKNMIQSALAGGVYL